MPFLCLISLHFTQRIRSALFNAALLLIFLLGSSKAQAIDLLPDDLIAPPVGVSLIQIAHAEHRRSEIYQRGEKLALSPDPEYNYTQLHLRYARSFDWNGKTSVAYIQLPYYNVRAENVVNPFNGVQARNASGGVGDVVLLLATWLKNDRQKGHYAGIAGYLFVPTGEYDIEYTRLVNTNPGANRWRAALQFGNYLQLSKSIGWMVAFDSLWATKNTEAYWSSPTPATRRQEPLNTFQTGLNYQITPKLNLGLNYFFAVGGRSSINSVKNDDTVRSHRAQISAGYFLSPTLRLIGQFGAELKTETGFKETGATTISITQYF